MTPRKDLWRAHAGQAMGVDRLTGFCLLARRSVFERVGGLDESMPAGFFTDDDLCLRARDAGFRLALAQGVYIHHHGGATFTGLRLDARGDLHL